MKPFYLPNAVNIFLILLGCQIFGHLSNAYAQMQCHSIFAVNKYLPTKTLSNLQIEMHTNLRKNEDLILWQSYLDSIESLNDYHQFLAFIHDFHSKEFFVQHSLPPEKILGEEVTFDRLNYTNWVQPILKLRHQMTHDQKLAVLTKFQKIVSELRTKNIPNRERWARLDLILQLALFPQTIGSFIDALPKETQLVFEHDTYFNEAAQSALKALPMNQLVWARDRISGRLIEALKDTDEDGKEHRRNIETLHHVLFKENFYQFIRQVKTLNSKIYSPEKLIQMIDSYWQQSLGGFRKVGRSKYSFRLVLDSASLIQRQLREEIGDSYIDLYGSFSNGKADLMTSDIDIHPGSGLMKKYIEAFTENGHNYADLNATERWGKPIPDYAHGLSSALSHTEQKLAQLIKRDSFVPSELMTVVPAFPSSFSDFFVPSIIQAYNPLKVRIFKDRIEVHIFDSLDKNKSHILNL